MRCWCAKFGAVQTCLIQFCCLHFPCQLPAGGISAERRFVHLFPLICHRVYGPWNSSTPEEGLSFGSPSGVAGPRGSPAASPGGSAYSSSAASPAPSGERPAYRHAEGGWLGLSSCPSPRPPAGHDSGRHGAPRRPASTTSSSLDRDPLVRLLRAPRRGTLRSAGDEVHRDGGDDAPTLLDALSAEAVQRPAVRFRFPLSATLSRPLAEDWEACFWDGFEGEAATAAGRRASSPRGGDGVGWRSGGDDDDGHVQGVVGKENATRILLHLLSGGPKNQPELRAHFRRTYQQQRRPPGQPLGAFAPFASPQTPPSSRGAPTLGGYHTPGHGRNAPLSSNDGSGAEPHLELTMLEYYFFLFVRFPLASGSWEDPSPEHRRHRHGLPRPAPPYGQRVHAHLYSSYLQCYLAHGRRYEAAALRVGVGCCGGAATTRAPAAGASGVADADAAARDRTSELFLRLVVEFWIEGANAAPPAAAAVARYHRVRAGASSGSRALRPSLSDALELAQPFRTFRAPPSQVQANVLTLVRHVVSDGSLRELVQGVAGRLQRRQQQDRAGPIGGDQARRSAPPSGDDVPWCLPPAATALQPSLFNYIRLGLACGAIHDRSSCFHQALETWLVWLEPWNCVMKRRAIAGARPGGGGGGGDARRAGDFLRNAAATVSSHHRVEYYPSYVRPKPTSASAYSAKWEAYLATNLHFYTVPLAIFLKRARELDFSSNLEYQRSFVLLRKVLRVYSKPVVNVLNSLLNQTADVWSMSLFARHGTNMGAFCPPNAWKLVQCQTDAINLMEEVFSQYSKRRADMDTFERIEAWLNALFHGKISGEATAIENLLTQVKTLVNLPLDYHLLADKPGSSVFGLWELLGQNKNNDLATSAGYEHSLGPDREADGSLSDLGRQQIYRGERKCDPMDVHYIGDPMLARVKSYEVPLLVELTVGVSKYVNEKVGWTGHMPEEAVADGTQGQDMFTKKMQEMKQYQSVVFRLNLRFLADPRNIAFIAIVFWLVRTIAGFF